jgi:hypothetical protein
MTAYRTLIALSVAALATACASPGAMNAAPASPGVGNASTPERMAAMDSQMKTMHEMHQKVMNAKTPEERQALMADHMTAMQGGMAMMKDMQGMQGMGGMGGGKGMPADMSGRHQMMTDHMAMMQMMMDMMMQRMPSALPAK